MSKYKHLTLDERIQISGLLDKSESFKSIGRLLEKDCTTISKEVRAHLVFKKVGALGRPYNACVHRRSCSMANLCDPCTVSKGYRKCSLCKRCNDHCPNFEAEVCHRLEKAPYVCNGCPDKAKCTLEKRFYQPGEAHSEYQETLSESRQGICSSKEEIEHLDSVISPLVRKGQSIHHICVNNKDSIMVSESKVYRLIDYGVFSARNIDLPRKVRYSARKQKKNLKVDKQCRVGRTYEDYLLFVKENPDLPTTEIDSVEGKKGGKVLLTIHFVNAELMLAYLRDANDAQSVIDIFDHLYIDLLPDIYLEIFPLLLGDNGSEFSDPRAIEFDRQGNRRSYLFYCDASAPYQKGSAEKNHEHIRSCIPKGTSLDGYTQEMISFMMDNINSLTRKSLGDKCPYDVFSFLHGEKVLDLLGCHRIPANEVELTPRVFSRFR